MAENNTIENNHTDSEANVLMMKKIVSKDYTFIFKDKYFRNDVTVIVADKNITISTPNVSAIMFAFFFVIFFIATIIFIIKKH